MFSVRSRFRSFFPSSRLFLLAAALLPTAVLATSVRLQTTLGNIDIELYDTAAPKTVANFLAYVNSGAYNNTIFHRSVSGFVLQGGGFSWKDGTDSGPVRIATAAPVANEASTTRPNLRGTIAMAKQDGNPNSATSEWFINLGNNSALDSPSNNGGFTVFGNVTASSMAVVDALAAIPAYNVNSPIGLFQNFPLRNLSGTVIDRTNILFVTQAAVYTPPPPVLNYQGLWWNANESGWGMSLTQHNNIIFAAVYAYDAAGQPVWYVLPNCALTANSCSSDIYKVTGGASPTQSWHAGTAAKVGSGKLTFASIGAGKFEFTIDGVAASKDITPQVFATGTNKPAVDYTDIWWNAAESGWGIALTQQYGMIFAAWYTYDDAGKPTWYVAPSCAIAGAGCTGSIYRVTGCTALTSPWVCSETGTTNKKVVTEVGNVSFTFNTVSAGTMNYSINGVSSLRAITRQPF